MSNPEFSHIESESDADDGRGRFSPPSPQGALRRAAETPTGSHPGPSRPSARRLIVDLAGRNLCRGCGHPACSCWVEPENRIGAQLSDEERAALAEPPLLLTGQGDFAQSYTPRAGALADDTEPAALVCNLNRATLLLLALVLFTGLALGLAISNFIP